ncbi:potassium-transporting ATPase subunit KdpC [Eggerthella sp. YY7918]|uniref:potassium-transporting ATPase subunit KdpC n=1 Tax=Eggerthella sp. (strain YY7918) TaxID=502558 RepID=UPI0002170FA6|nr:potassium-transporting ATPase subunit KdpC [Eggerthella sp. YY7918]BAK43821.1 hypothetical protein EGYY_06100 [Eggerthella sp. YY7918]
MTNAKTWVTAALFFLAATLLCGVLYTAAVTGITQLLFPWQTNGSIIEVDGTKYGSTLVGQQFSSDTHLWGRPANANTHAFTDAAGNPLMWYGPSNLSPASDEFSQLVSERVQTIRAAHPEQGDHPIPSDLVTCSGSGLDPHISPAAAEYQVDRLARTTGRSASDIRAIIEACTEQPQFGVLGQARVNVLKVNLMLDGIL